MNFRKNYLYLSICESRLLFSFENAESKCKDHDSTRNGNDYISDPCVKGFGIEEFDLSRNVAPLESTKRCGYLSVWRDYR